ncbi:glyoxalase [Ornithinibacillus sp. L9]|uniref:Glyoxalase n=1 Tax=Ornithinibacillus caprae TaxID=2678566 RepID=A0A6N8FIU7_9BACI|nr:VOC family protein [Ornithinibacillus caprae]MUK89353.1 glyoxalase [Ornithinibacillus caprae]
MEKKFFQKPTVYVGEVNINVTNLKKALHFYQNILGFTVLEQSDSSAVLTADGKTPLLSLEQPIDVTPKQPRTTGLYHFAILLPSRADLSSFVKHIIRAGVQLGASDHYVSEALYFNDPDGNGIEVYRDRPSAEWSWTDGQVAMATEPLDGDSLVAESNKEWGSMPKETIMGHIHLHVSDLEETEKFFVNGLGFDIVTRYSGALFASTGGYHHHIGLNVWNGVGAKAPAKNSVGLNWFALVFPDEESRNKAVDRLGEIGSKVTKNFEVKDPSGNVIRLVI